MAARQRRVAARTAEAEEPKQPPSRDRILNAAVREFAHRGLSGARVDVIAREAAINKQLIYYHYGSKEALYVGALEKSYRDLRAREKDLELGGLDPIAAMTRFVEFTFDYVIEHREFVLLLMNENLQEARYLKQSEELKAMRGPLASILEGILQRGVELGTFHAGVEPLKLYTTIASLCFFYSSNIYTLSVFLDTDLTSRAELESHKRHIIEVVLGYLASKQSEEGRFVRASAGRAGPARRPRSAGARD